MGFTLQPAARRDLVDVAVNVDLQQRARMIGWTSGRFWNHTVKAQRPEIQLIDKHVDHPHRVVLSNVVIQILGKQNALYTVFTLDEARHLTPRRESSRIITQQAFSHSLHPLLKFTPEHYRKFCREKPRALFAPRGFCTELVHKRADEGKNAFDDAFDSRRIGMQSIAKYKSWFARHPFE